MANPLPPLDDEQYAILRADIEANGITDPIDICAISGDLLDGHNRRRIAEQLGIECPSRKILGLHTEDDRLAYSLRRNMNRRQMTKAQRDKLREEQQQIALRFAELGRTQEEIAAALGVVRQTVSKWLKKAGTTSSANGGKASSPDQRRTLTDDDVAEIIGRLANGQRQTRIAEHFDVSQQRIAQLAQEHEHEWRKLPAVVGEVEIRCGDARDHYPDDVADLAFFSPPYNVGLDYEDDGDDDALPDHKWRDLLTTTLEVLRDGWQVGRIVVNLPADRDRRPYRQLLLPEIDDLELEAVIVWDKGTTGNRTSWGSWRQPSAPAIRDRTERLYVLRTPNQLRGVEDALVMDGDKRVSQIISSAQFTTLTQDLWSVPPESASGVGHPAPFPIELARRVISLYGWLGCRVIDPFAGSGTTALAAIELGCAAIVNDQSEHYSRLALRRVLEASR